MPRRAQRPVLCVSIGCPAGIGPEVAVAAAARFDAATTVLVGDRAVIARAARLRRVAARRLVPVDDAEAMHALEAGRIGVWSPSTPVGEVTPGVPTPDAGAAQLAWIDEAIELVRRGDGDALVTAPVSKAAIASSGAPGARRFTGHTEHIARRLRSGEPVMAFSGPGVAISLVTTHLAIARVPRAITRERVVRSSIELAGLCRRVPAPGWGARKPRLAVCGLNPHAGEGGLLGTEEIRVIAPAVAAARAELGRGVELLGPIGAETAFRLAMAKELRGVVAMYHDQATIAGKLLGFGEMVNVTLGLPIVRTSVDHGTAYDRAGSGTASDEGMCSALALATVLARARAA